MATVFAPREGGKKAAVCPRAAAPIPDNLSPRRAP